MDSSGLPLLVYNALAGYQIGERDFLTLSGSPEAYLVFELNPLSVDFSHGFAALTEVPRKKFWDGGEDLRIWMRLPDNHAWRDARTVARVWTTSVRRATADEIRELGGELDGHVAFIREIRWQGVGDLHHPAASFASKVLQIAAEQAKILGRDLYWVPLSALPLD